MNRSATKSRKVHTFSSGSYLERLMGELDRASIALRLAEARERAGLTQEELGDLLHVHWRTIQNYESPRIDRIPWDRLDEWGRITDTTKEWLLHGDPTAEATQDEGVTLAAVLAQLQELQATQARLEAMLSDLVHDETHPSETRSRRGSRRAQTG